MEKEQIDEKKGKVQKSYFFHFIFFQKKLYFHFTKQTCQNIIKYA